MKVKSFTACYLFIIAGIFYLLTQTGCTATKQAEAVVGASEAEVGQAVSDDRWIFRTNRVMPQSGRTRNVTGIYEVRCTKDTLVVQLPYFGRAFSGAATMSTQSPLDFRSTDFTINKKENDKGKWDVVIKPNDYREVQSMTFTFFNNGSAQLNVQLTNRTPISFSGNVMPRR